MTGVQTCALPILRFNLCLETGDTNTYRVHGHIMATGPAFWDYMDKDKFYEYFHEGTDRFSRLWPYGICFRKFGRSPAGIAHYQSGYTAKKAHLDFELEGLGRPGRSFVGVYHARSSNPGLGLPMIFRMGAIQGAQQAKNIEREGMYFDQTDLSWYQERDGCIYRLGPNAQYEDLTSGLRYHADGRLWSRPMDRRAAAEFDAGYRAASGIWRRAPGAETCRVYDALSPERKHKSDLNVLFTPERREIYADLVEGFMTGSEYNRALLNMRGVVKTTQKDDEEASSVPW